MTQSKLTSDILTAALEGFAIQKDRLDAKVAEIQHMLNGSHIAPATPIDVATKPRKKRSAAVRRKMALAQKARWAKLKLVAEPPQAVAAKLKKRKLSAAGRKAIIDAIKKRWAAVKAAKQAAKPAAVKNAVSKKAVAKKAA
jgi:hypothetical protein